jgi:hypothetical protein
MMDSKEAMKLACKQVGVKNVAESLELSPSALYNQMNESKGDSKKNRKDPIYFTGS